jgi:hypothetical protein
MYVLCFGSLEDSRCFDQLTAQSTKWNQYQHSGQSMMEALSVPSHNLLPQFEYDIAHVTAKMELMSANGIASSYSGLSSHS